MFRRPIGGLTLEDCPAGTEDSRSSGEDSRTVQDRLVPPRRGRTRRVRKRLNSFRNVQMCRNCLEQREATLHRNPNPITLFLPWEVSLALLREKNFAALKIFLRLIVFLYLLLPTQLWLSFSLALSIYISFYLAMSTCLYPYLQALYLYFPPPSQVCLPYLYHFILLYLSTLYLAMSTYLYHFLLLCLSAFPFT